MNYRHAYHAGNFADCVKHIILTLCIVYMQRKEQAFRVLDTHAGPGLYDLAGEAAQKTGEWRGGGRRVVLAPTPSGGGGGGGVGGGGGGGGVGLGFVVFRQPVA